MNNSTNNERIFNNFELLLSAAAEISAMREVEEFLALDTTGMRVSDKTRKRIERMIHRRAHKRSAWSVAKVALVACLLALASAFTACMCIPKIRNAIKSVVIEWYDEYISVDFPDTPIYGEAQTEGESETESSAESVPTNAVLLDPPSAIEQKAYAAYLPDGYTAVTLAESNTFYYLSFQYNNEPTIYLTQTIIEKELTWADGEEISVIETSIGTNKALFITKNSKPNFYILLWQDGVYEYNLNGYFSSYEEMIRIAENIKLSEE